MAHVLNRSETSSSLATYMLAVIALFAVIAGIYLFFNYDPSNGLTPSMDTVSETNGTASSY